jgi:hypothetical protein
VLIGEKKATAKTKAILGRTPVPPSPVGWDRQALTSTQREERVGRGRRLFEKDSVSRFFASGF